MVRRWILTFLRRNGRVAPNKPLRRNRNGDGSDGEDKFIDKCKQPACLYKWVYDLI